MNGDYARKSVDALYHCLFCFRFVKFFPLLSVNINASWMVFCFSLSWTKIPVQNSLVVQIILYAFLFSQVLFSNSARIFCSRLMKTKITQNISFSAAMICMFVFLLLLLLPTKLTFVDNCVSLWERFVSLCLLLPSLSQNWMEESGKKVAINFVSAFPKLKCLFWNKKQKNLNSTGTICVFLLFSLLSTTN